MQNQVKRRLNNTNVNVMAAIAIGAMLVFSVAGTKAFADNVVNDVAVDTETNSKTVTITAGATTTVSYWIVATSASTDASGCNPTSANPTTVTVVAPSGVSASKSTLSFTACGKANSQSVDFSSDNDGNYDIQVDASGGKTGSTYNETPATFTLAVEEDTPPTPTDTTAPEVTSITVDDNLISEADVGSSSFEVVVTYNEAMNTNTDPTIAFDPSVTSTLSGGSGAWSSSDTVFTATYDVADGNVEQKDVDVSVSGAKDIAGNTQGSKTTADLFGIDTIAPQGIAFSGITDGQTFYFGDPLPTVTCSADDDSFGPATCDVTPQSLPTTVATHTLTATAKDTAGNTAEATITYTVDPWTLKGFYQPVDMNGVYNLVKAGSIVPLKFEVFKGSTELTDIGVRDTVTQKKVTCDTAATVDEIEQYTTTGQTTFRYDTSGGQFIDNWKSPTTKNACYQVTMTFDDGSSLVALFKTK